MIKVMFTGGGGAGNEALWRLLGHRYVLHFGDADPNTINPTIPEDRRHQLPWASDPDLLSKMIDLCHRRGIDLLIPGVDEELVTLAKSVDVLAPTRLLLPHADYVITMLDKLSMIHELEGKKICVPSSRILTDDIDSFSFPCIIKPRNSRGSRGVHVLKSHMEATALNSVLGGEAQKMLLQEKIEGTEYTVQMVANADGRLCAVVPVKIDVKQGITIRAETDSEQRVINACREIHEALPTFGCYNIQLILTPEGNVIPFEINPRISTTLCLTIAAGIDPIKIFLENVQSSDLQPFVVGVRLQRHWTNYFSNGNNL